MVRDLQVGPEGTSVTLQPGADPETQTTSISGWVLDPDGLPIEGIRVTLSQRSSNRFDQSRTDGQGRFSFEGVIAGLGEFERAHGTVDQLDAQASLELADALARRRLADTEQLRGF